jgi:recombination protein RecA
MKSAALEAVLSDFSTLVVPAAHLERPSVPTVRCGIGSVDELTGGLPRGCLTEICGPASSGRTTLLLSAVAEATARGEVCALVDASDSFDPLSAQQAGVDLERVLWVRCANSAEQHSLAHRGTQLGGGKSQFRSQKSEFEAFDIASSSAPNAAAKQKEKQTRFMNSGMKNCGSRGVHTQLYSGMPALPEINVLTRPEQRYRDINKLKQGDYSDPGRPIPPQRHRDAEAHPAFGIGPADKSTHGFARISTDKNQRNIRRGSTRIDDFKSEIKNQKSKIELSRVEQALKVTDLLLQSGGFGLIALDLGDIGVRNARRVPLTSWFRFRRAVENTATVLLVLEREAHARSCASLVLDLQQSSTQSEEQLSLIDAPITEEEKPSHAELLTGIASHAEVARGERKSMGSVRAEFTARSAWSA